MRMPDSICDEKVLKKSLEENKKLVADAEKKIKYYPDSDTPLPKLELLFPPFYLPSVV